MSCAAIFGCGMPYESREGVPSYDVAAAKALLKEANVDLAKPIVMLHVANAPGIAASHATTPRPADDLRWISGEPRGGLPNDRRPRFPDAGARSRRTA